MLSDREIEIQHNPWRLTPSRGLGSKARG